VKYENHTTYQSKVISNVKVFEKKVKFQGQQSISRSWYQMKDLASRNTHVKYESLTTYQLKVMTKVKVFERKKSNSKVKGLRVKVMVFNERSCQKEYTCEI
jgi:DNA-binding transcriptional regulator of glucitol operon